MKNISSRIQTKVMMSIVYCYSGANVTVISEEIIFNKNESFKWRPLINLICMSDNSPNRSIYDKWSREFTFISIIEDELHESLRLDNEVIEEISKLQRLKKSKYFRQLTDLLRGY